MAHKGGSPGRIEQSLDIGSLQHIPGAVGSDDQEGVADSPESTMPTMTLELPKDLSAAKEEILRRTHDYLYPGRVERLLGGGIDFVPGRRRGRAVLPE